MGKPESSGADGMDRRRASRDLVKAKDEAIRLVTDLHIAIHGGSTERAMAEGRLVARLDLIVEHVSDAKCS